MVLIDTHAHLDYPEFDADRDEVVRRAAEAGVTRIISIGTNLESSQRAIALAEKYEGVFASVGIHPNDCVEANDDAITRLRELAKHPKVVAIGETGLDYHYLPSKLKSGNRREEVGNPPPHVGGYEADEARKSLQAKFFRAQLELAVELGKPVIIHQRDSIEDVVRMIEEFRGREVRGREAAPTKIASAEDRGGDAAPAKNAAPKRLRGVFHCFGENYERAERVLGLGFNISFTGILTFKNAASLREVAARLPLERVMMETDCPFLAPQPHRGKRCEPAHTRLVAEQLAAVKGCALEEVARVTTATARGFFGI
jgi:TatD DNase family protein